MTLSFGRGTMTMGPRSLSALCRRICGAISDVFPVSSVVVWDYKSWVCCFEVVCVSAMIHPFATVLEPLN